MSGDDMKDLVSREEREEIRKNLAHLNPKDSVIHRLLLTLDQKDAELELAQAELIRVGGAIQYALIGLGDEIGDSGTVIFTTRYRKYLEKQQS